MSKLSVLGLGLRCPEQTSRRTLEALEKSDQLFLISDHLDKQDWLARLNPNFYNLMVHYGPGKPRRETYQEMADQVLACLHQGRSAALVSYGHPLVFCDPSRLAIQETAQAGFEVEIQPGISSIDCLLADLRVDVQNYGLQVYEGHDLLLHGLVLDPGCSQVVFQVPSLGDSGGGWKPGRFRGFIRALAERLADTFGWNHEVVLYFGSNSPSRPTQVDRLPLSRLEHAEMVSEYTLWVPPLGYASLPPELAPRDQPVELELVGYGLEWSDRTQEMSDGLQGRIFSLQPLPELPEAEVIQRFEQLPTEGPKTVIFPAHPCNSGAVEWARAAAARGWSYRIRPAISWEDGLYCHVPMDPGLLGFQAFPPGARPSLPVHLTTLVYRTPEEGVVNTPPGAQYWGPRSGFQQAAQPDTLGLYLPGPQPRPLENAPFVRALQLSAVERLVAFLERNADRLPFLKKNPSQKPPPNQHSVAGGAVDPRAKIDSGEGFRQTLRGDYSPAATSPKMWLNLHLQAAGKALREALQNSDLGSLNEGRWAEYLTEHPEHPQAPVLLLRIRCEEALQANAKGVSLDPLVNWLKETP